MKLFSTLKRKYFTVEYMCNVDDIRSVRIISGHFATAPGFEKKFISARLVLNGCVTYLGEDALRSARALLDCGYLKVQQRSRGKTEG
jgi:hypothetical protein